MDKLLCVAGGMVAGTALFIWWAVRSIDHALSNVIADAQKPSR